jgi:hypothetical protein
LGGIAVSNSANASVIAQVAVFGNTQAETERWGAGWDACQAEDSRTHSVKLSIPGDKTGPWGSGLPNQWVAYWQCYDTDNVTADR